jgi:hypothetical protein
MDIYWRVVLSAAVVRTLDPGVVTGTGTVVVTPELRVKLATGTQNVWAIGDIIEWPEQKVCDLVQVTKLNAKRL